MSLLAPTPRNGASPKRGREKTKTEREPPSLTPQEGASGVPRTRKGVVRGRPDWSTSDSRKGNGSFEVKEVLLFIVYS